MGKGAVATIYKKYDTHCTLSPVIVKTPRDRKKWGAKKSE